MKEVLFICTANYYRSRFAEAFFNFTKGDDLCDWRAISRGFNTDYAPTSLSPHTRDIIDGLGIPPSCYHPVPLQLERADLEEAELVIALKQEEHQPMMETWFPDWISQIRYWDVHDLDVWEPDQTLPAIQIQVGLLLQELLEKRNLPT